MDSFFAWIYTVITTVFNTVFGFIINPIADQIQRDVDITVESARNWGDNIYAEYLQPYCGRFDGGCAGVASAKRDLDKIVDDYTTQTMPAVRRSITSALAMYTGIGLLAILGLFLFAIIV